MKQHTLVLSKNYFGAQQTQKPKSKISDDEKKVDSLSKKKKREESGQLGSCVKFACKLLVSHINTNQLPNLKLTKPRPQ